ncbi:MAG TPA: PAS domain S-box protein [Actinomycetota bacterium]|nr:PAS domain S-box protein [Actinomycetota bacterium]
MIEGLPDEAAFFAAIVESTDDAVLSKTLDGTITSWNAAAERMYGYTRAEAVGNNVRMLLPPGRPGEIDQILDRIRSGERIEHFDTYRRRKDGRILDVSLTISPVRDADGVVVGASTIARDVTERREAQEALERYTREIEQSNRDLERFAYVVSHDLAEPLRMISSFVQLLGEEFGDRLDDRGREYVDFVLEGSARMRALIDDLLAYSRLGSEAVAVTAVDLGVVAGRVVDVLAVAIHEAGAEVTVDDLPEVAADAIKIEQLLRNLVANALKFRREDEAPRVHIDAGRVAGGCRICVSDNGIGIEPRHSERVFEMFQRLHTRDEFPGTGVGLTICKRIVDLHEGRIWFEPNEPHGTRFCFTIPDRDRVEQEAVHVLLVEDNPGDVLLMRQGLATWNHPVEVHVVSNGEEALDFLRREGPHAGAAAPDLVLLDVNLPRLKGDEVLARMRADPSLERIPVAVMSSSSAEARIAAAYDSTTTTFVLKPMDVPEYRAAVRDVERFWTIAARR